MSWKKELEEKLKREKLSEKLGGSERESKDNMILVDIQFEKEFIF